MTTYRLTTHDGTVLNARVCDTSDLPSGQPDELGIGTIAVTGIDTMEEVAVPFISGWARFGDDVVLIPPTEVKPYYIYLELEGATAVFPYPMLEYYKTEEILILMSCGFILKKTTDIPADAAFAFHWSNVTHEYGFWRQVVNGVHCFADMLQNYAHIPVNVRPDVREFMSMLPLFPLELSSGEALGFYIGCMAPFAMLQSFNIDRDYRVMRKIVVQRTFSGIMFPDWFDPYNVDEGASLWERTDRLYIRNSEAAITWITQVCPEAKNWLPRLREWSMSALSICSAFEAILLEKARWTAMNAYTARQCALCGSTRLTDSILCQYHWDSVAPHENRTVRMEAARVIALIFHQIAILGFQVTIVRVNTPNDGRELGVHCLYPDGCRLTTGEPISLTGATQIGEWMERLIKHAMTHHQLQPARK